LPGRAPAAIIGTVPGTLAAEWGTGQVAWSLFWIALVVLWIYLVIRVLADILTSHELGGVAKVLWILVIIVIPYLGVFAYVVARGDSMSARSASWGYADRTGMRPLD
jgi:hypothetical protein